MKNQSKTLNKNKTITKPQTAKPAKLLPMMTAAAVFAAVTAIMTAFVRIPAPFGYIHPGDTVIFLAAALLPHPAAAAAAGLGAGFADLIAGYPLYIPATIVIKALMTLSFEHGANIITRRNIFACAAALVIGAGGYLLYDFLIYGAGAAAGLPLNLIQEIASGVIFVVLGKIIDESGVKKFLTF